MLIEMADQFAMDVRSCFPPLPNAIAEGKELFGRQDFQRRLSITATARAVLRCCAAYAGTRKKMVAFFRGDTLHFQHLYCIDDLLKLLPAICQRFDLEKDTASFTPEQRILMLEVALFSAELSQDRGFGFSHEINAG